GVLFKELVEQHRVDLLVTDGEWFSFFILQDQGRMHFCYVFSNQAPLGRVGLVALVVEGYGSKRIDRFTGLAHRVNVLLESRRGGNGTKLAARVNNYGGRKGANTLTGDTGDETR